MARVSNQKKGPGVPCRVKIEPVPGKAPVYFVLPFDPKEAFGQVRAPVTVTVGDYTFETRVASMFGHSVVGLNTAHKKAAGLEAGQTVTVVVEADTKERKVTPPDDLVRALKKHKGALAAFQKLAYSHQKEHVRAIEEAKRPETRARRIEKCVAMLAT